MGNASHCGCGGVIVATINVVVAIGSMVISLVLMIFTIITFGSNRRRESDAFKEGNVKINVKLDQICQSLTEMRVEQKGLTNRITELDKEISVIKEKIRTCFTAIDELKNKE